MVTPTYDRLWSPVLDTVRADALDCVQANLATVADRLGGAGAHLTLGAALRFETEWGAGGVPRVAASLDHRLAAARELLGLRVAERRDGVDGPTVRAMVAEHGPLYVVADAYGLQWTPFYGRQHVEHTFLLAAPDTVVDAYQDQTPWGQCHPGVWRISPAELDAAVPAATVLRLAAGTPIPPGDVLHANARQLAAAGPAIEEYLAASRPDTSGLVLDIWLLGRSRLLHAAWLAGQGLPDADLAERARAWLALASTSYVVLRRATSGPPATVLDEMRELLHEDAAAAQRLAADVVGGVRATLVDVVGEVLRIEERGGVSGVPLRELPNYNSLRLVEIVERAEVRLGVRLDDTDLTPQALRDVDSLCAAFERRRAAH